MGIVFVCFFLVFDRKFGLFFYYIGVIKILVLGVVLLVSFGFGV